MEVPFERDLRRVFDIGLRMNFEERNSDKRFVDLMIEVGKKYISNFSTVVYRKVENPVP